MPTLDALLADYPVIVPVHVHWGEMDAFQHLNNTVYFRYFETARIAYFLRSHVVGGPGAGALGNVEAALQTTKAGGGDGPAKRDDDGHLEVSPVGPILASTSCRFKAPVTYPDTVAVGATVSDVGADRFTMRYAVASQTLGRIAAEGEGVIVAYDYERKAKAPLPQRWRDGIAALGRVNPA